MSTRPSTSLGNTADAAFSCPFAAVGEYPRGVERSRLVADVDGRPGRRRCAGGAGRIGRVRPSFSSRPAAWGRSAPPPFPPAGGGGGARRRGAPPPPPVWSHQERLDGLRSTGFLPEYRQAGGRSAAAPPAPPSAGDFPPSPPSKPLTIPISMHNLHGWPITATAGLQPPEPSPSSKAPQKWQSGPRNALVEPIRRLRSRRVSSGLSGRCFIFRSFK